MSSRRRSKPRLVLDWATVKAARYACEHWHYSGSYPLGKTVRVGVWEDGVYIGAVIFARGAGTNLPKRFGLTHYECTELCRVALREHATPVSKILSIAIRMLRDLCPGLRVIVSFADTKQNHHGGIYQAAGWYYIGDTAPKNEYRAPGGKIVHDRRVTRSGFAKVYDGYVRCYRIEDCTAIPLPPKHRYVLPLDQAMRDKVEQWAKPYPKRQKQAMTEAHSEQRRCSADPAAPSSSE